MFSGNPDLLSSVFYNLPGTPELSFDFRFHPLDINSGSIRAHSEASDRNSNKTK